MPSTPTFVIVGTGLAGIRAATALRTGGFDGRVVVVGEERGLPYDRVTLSKHHLTGRPGFHPLYLHDAAFYTDRHIELVRGAPATKVDVRRHDLVLASGRRFRYDALLLATGAESRRWRGPGADLAGVHYLRTLADADGIRDALTAASTSGGRVAVIGTGWIGCEVAAAARQLGLPVTLIGRREVPLAGQIGSQMGEYFRQVHARHGVEMVLGADVVALTGPGTVEQVVLADGTLVDADVVVVAIGAQPRTELARPARIALDDGIVTDEYFRTSAPDIFAAGDVASVPNAAVGDRQRFGHFATALTQGAAAARAMMGERRPYRQIPFFFSDQYDLWMECTGMPSTADRVVFRMVDAEGADVPKPGAVRPVPGGDNDAQVVDWGKATGAERFIAFWLRGRHVTAGMNINIKRVPDQIAALIAANVDVDETALADPSIPLTEFVTGMPATTRRG